MKVAMPPTAAHFPIRSGSFLKMKSIAINQITQGEMRTTKPTKKATKQVSHTTRNDLGPPKRLPNMAIMKVPTASMARNVPRDLIQSFGVPHFMPQLHAKGAGLKQSPVNYLLGAKGYLRLVWSDQEIQVADRLHRARPRCLRDRRVLQRSGRPALLDRAFGFLSTGNRFPAIFGPERRDFLAGTALDFAPFDIVGALEDRFQ